MTPIRPRKLADDVQDRLLELIRESRAQPGDYLPSERDLMVRLGVGRPVIREAMQRLSQMGLVDIRQGGRARISEPTASKLIDQMSVSVRHLLTHAPASVENLREARTVFEREIARIAARKRSQADIDRMRAIVDTQEQAIGDRERFVQLDGQFHRELAAITGNPIFTALSEAIFNWLNDHRSEMVRLPGGEAQTIAEHRQLLDAIEAGNEDRAARALQDHLYRVNQH